MLSGSFSKGSHFSQSRCCMVVTRSPSAAGEKFRLWVEGAVYDSNGEMFSESRREMLSARGRMLLGGGLQG